MGLHLGARHIVPGLLAAGLLAAAPVRAQWAPDGVPLCLAPDSQLQPLIASDGRGGAFVAWRDIRDYPDYASIYAQHVTAEGKIAPGWPAEGLPICVANENQFPSAITADGAGGAYIVWVDYRNAYTSLSDIYVQRVSDAGTIHPGWALNGNLVCADPGYQIEPRVVSDGTGGLFVVWHDFRRGPFIAPIYADIYAQRITPQGAPAPGWAADGRPVCIGPGNRWGVNIISDGSGGFIAGWSDGRSIDTSKGVDVYAQRITSGGALAAGWIENGMPVCTAPGLQAISWLISDERGGMIAVFVDGRAPTPPGEDSSFNIYAQRVTGSGTIAPGWPEDARPLCTAEALQWNAKAVSDGKGGAIVAWEDYRNYSLSASDLYAQRILASGEIAPGWPVDGARLSDRPSWDTFYAIVPDANGGMLVAYADGSGPDDLFIQHLSASGALAPEWSLNGRRLCESSSSRSYPVAASDGVSGMIVAWQEFRDLTTLDDIYAQWVGGERIITSTPTVTGVGLHRLVSWTLSAPAPGSTWAVLRARNDGPFESIAKVEAGAGVELSWEDTSPPAGVLRYRIRREVENPQYQWESPEAVWPSPARRSLTLARGVGAGELELSGTDAGRVQVRVYDVQGRLVHERRLMGVIGDVQRFDLTRELRAIGAGIYFATVRTHDDRTTAPLKLVVLK